MTRGAIIPAVVRSSATESSPILYERDTADRDVLHTEGSTHPEPIQRRVSYGALPSELGGSVRPNSKGKQPASEDGFGLDDDDGSITDDGQPQFSGTSAPILCLLWLSDKCTVTWKYISRLYLLVPFFSLIFWVTLVLLITFAWSVVRPANQTCLLIIRPPTKKERQNGQIYPHPFLWMPFVVGVFASFTVQSIRVPVFVIVDWLGLSPRLTMLL
jgi:hypothetical protein